MQFAIIMLIRNIFLNITRTSPRVSLTLHVARNERVLMIFISIMDPKRLIKLYSRGDLLYSYLGLQSLNSGIEDSLHPPSVVFRGLLMCNCNCVTQRDADICFKDTSLSCTYFPNDIPAKIPCFSIAAGTQTRRTAYQRLNSCE